MQPTPFPTNQTGAEMPRAAKIETAIGMGVSARGMKENIISFNLAHQPRRASSMMRLQREERRPAEGGRTPCRDEATPQRGRDHPAATPSPTLLGTDSVQREQSRWCVPLHDCGLFGSPLLDTTTPSSHADQLGQGGAVRDLGDHGQSAPARQAGSVQDTCAHDWACAACTLVNASDATRCVVCDALKGSTLASAGTLSLHMSHGARPPPPAKCRAGGSGSSHSSSSVGRNAQSALTSSYRQTDITDFVRPKP